MGEVGLVGGVVDRRERPLPRDFLPPEVALEHPARVVRRQLRVEERRAHGVRIDAGRRLGCLRRGGGDDRGRVHPREPVDEPFARRAQPLRLDDEPLPQRRVVPAPAQTGGVRAQQPGSERMTRRGHWRITGEPYRSRQKAGCGMSWA